MIIWAIVATVIALALLIALIQYRNQIRKNCRQLQVMQKHSSNQRLTSEVPYGEINELVMRVNDICNRYQQDSIQIERNENNLKEAIANLGLSGRSGALPEDHPEPYFQPEGTSGRTLYLYQDAGSAL